MSTPPQLPPLPTNTPTDALTVAQRDALVLRLQAAWRNLPTATQAALRPLLADGHNQLAAWLNGGPAPTHHTQMILRLQSYISNDIEGLLARAGHPLNLAATQSLASPIPAQAIQVGTAPDGSILGTGQYQQFDLGWELIAGTVWLEHILFKHPFPPGAPDSPEPIPGHLRLLLLSDWGTGNFGPGDSPAVKISKFIPKLLASLQPTLPTYGLHLGDVYYAGLRDEEQNNFLNYWPQGFTASFALNANHEMYSGGGPYFNQVVGGPIFNKLQSPWSFFALETPHWIVLGLDSAYFSSAVDAYLNGTLGPVNDPSNPQPAFARKIAQHAAQTNKPVIVLTHHNPIAIGDATQTNQLYTDVVTTAFAGCPPPAFWYFGHEHLAAVYPLTNGIRFRCVGHGALPWGQSSDLATAQAAAKVTWYEHCLASDPNDTLRVFNGFALLELNGPTLTETFYDELGRVAFQPGNPGIPAIPDTRC